MLRQDNLKAGEFFLWNVFIKEQCIVKPYHLHSPFASI